MLGGTALTDISVEDDESDAPPVYMSGDLDTDDILDPGEVWTYSASREVLQADIDAGMITNIATAYGTFDEPDDFMDSGTVTVYADQNLSMTLDKTALEASYSAVDEVLNYTIEVENTGNVTITILTLTDTNADAPPAGPSGDNGNGTFSYNYIMPASIYMDGDQIEARFYSYISGQPVQTFVPGPDAIIWSEVFIYGTPVQEYNIETDMSVVGSEIMCYGSIIEQYIMRNGEKIYPSFPIVVQAGDTFVCRFNVYSSNMYIHTVYLHEVNIFDSRNLFDR